MNGWHFAAAALVVMLIAHAQRKKRAVSPRPQPNPAEPPPQPAPAPAPAARVPDVPPHGLRLADGQLQVADWTRWMRFGDRMIRRAVAEGAVTPEHVVARLFYAMYPEGTWPPPQDSALAPMYDAIVATMSENLDDALRPVRLAQQRGTLRLVD